MQMDSHTNLLPQQWLVSKVYKKQNPTIILEGSGRTQARRCQAHAEATAAALWLPHPKGAAGPGL